MSNSDSEESTSSGRSYRKNSVPSSVSRLSRLKNVGGTLEKPAELFRKDLISAMKLADSECLFPEDYILISDQWRQDWERGVQVPVNPEMEKSCEVRVMEDNESMYGSYGFKTPKKLLHSAADDKFKQSMHELHETHKLADEVCRYDLDYLDEVWLKKYNDIREQCGQEELSGWLMENLVEEFESRCYSSLKVAEAAGMEYDEDTVCDVCRMPDVEEGNEMVFCDGCDVGVHQACYGILKIPKGSWLCKTCDVGLKPKCALCTSVTGAMKITKAGDQWAHLSCAIWIPEVAIGCSEKMEPICNVDLIPSTRWNLICAVCRERSGACVQCCEKKCKTAFHVTCGFRKNFQMKINCEEKELHFKAYCDIHSKNGSLKMGESVLTSDELKTDDKTRMQSLREEFYLHVKYKEVADYLNIDRDTASFVFEYWKLKRKSNFDKPLLAPKMEESAMLMRQREDNLVSRLRMFIHLRQDLERVRNLCYMVIRRERTRTQLHQARKDLFQKQVDALNLDKLKPGSKDYELFSKIHKQNPSIYDRHAEITHAIKLQEGSVTSDKKEDSATSDKKEGSPGKEVSHELSIFSSPQSNISIQNFETPLKTPKSRVKNTTTPSTPKNQPPSSTKRKASTENPYARPTYKSFAWLLGTGRKRRKLEDSTPTKGENHPPPTLSASDPTCNSNIKLEGCKSGVVSTQSLENLRSHDTVREESKSNGVESIKITEHNVDTTKPQHSPAKSPYPTEITFPMIGVDDKPSHAIEAKSSEIVDVVEKKFEVKKNVDTLVSPRPRKICKTHEKGKKTPKKSGSYSNERLRSRKKGKEVNNLRDKIQDDQENVQFESSKPLNIDRLIASPVLLSPPHSSSPDVHADDLTDSSVVQLNDNHIDKEGDSVSTKKITSSYLPDDLCSDSDDVFMLVTEKQNGSSSQLQRNPLNSVKGRNGKTSDNLNGLLKESVKNSSRKHSAQNMDLLPPKRAKRSLNSKDLINNLVQSKITTSPLFSNKPQTLKTTKPTKVQETPHVDVSRNSDKKHNSTEKLPNRQKRLLKQSCDDYDDDDDFIDPPKFSKTLLVNGISKSNKKNSKTSGRIFNKKNVSPIIVSFQATLDNYLKSKDGETNIKTTPEKKDLLKNGDGHRGENDLIDPVVKRVVLKLDRITSSMEKVSPQKFPLPPDKKTLKNNSNLPRRKINVEKEKSSETRNKYPTRKSLNGCS